MPRTISDVNLFDTANNSEVLFLHSFVFLVRINSLIFFLCLPVSHVVGGPWNQFCSWEGNAKKCSVKFFWVDSLIIFPEFGVRHFESSHRIRIFFDIFRGICGCVVSINENVFCCGEKHFHIFCVVWFFFYICEFIVSGHCLFGKLIFLSLWHVFCCSKLSLWFY